MAGLQVGSADRGLLTAALTAVSGVRRSCETLEQGGAERGSASANSLRHRPRPAGGYAWARRSWLTKGRGAWVFPAEE